LKKNIAGGNDLAVLLLSKPLRKAHAKGAVCLPSKPAREHAGQMAIMAGWGATRDQSFSTYLQTVDLKIQPDCMNTPVRNGLQK
jgi:hypothetical protein